MSRIVIGKTAGKNAYMDVNAFLRTHLLIWASTGGGKSYLIRRLAEQLFGKIPIFLVDREGEFSTLREKYGFVLVGPGGETPADPRSAKIVCERLLELRASAVFDLFELGIEARHLWVKNFFEALVNSPKRLWGPTAVVLDEAHSFAPEKGQGESIAYPAVTDFVGVGRKRGFGAIFATQRLSKLSKNATAEMYNQAAGPTARQADRDRAAYEMGMSGKGPEVKAFTESLRVLEPGNFFFQGRAISMDMTLVEVGTVETVHATAGSAKYNAKVPPAPDEIKGLLPKLADLPKMAEEKARTEAEYKKQIASLKAQLRTAPVATKEIQVSDPKAIERAITQANATWQKKVAILQAVMEEAVRVLVKITAIGFDDASIKPEEIKTALDATAKEIARLAKAGLARRAEEFERLKKDTNRLLAKMNVAMSRENVTVDVKVEHNKPFTVTAPIKPQQPSRPQTPIVPIGDLTRPQAKILSALAEFESNGVKDPSRSMVASWCEVKAGTGSFKNYLSELRVAGLITSPGERLRLTDEGRARTPAVETAATQEELLNRAAGIFGSTTAKILRIIHRAHGEYVSREAIAAEIGVSAETGSFKNYISELRTAGMIEDGPEKAVKAADWLFSI